MKRTVWVFLICAGLLLGQLPQEGAVSSGIGGASALPTPNVIPRVSAPGVLGPSKCAVNATSPITLTCYDDTAGTGAFTQIIRAGAGQSTTNLQVWQNAAGAVLSFVGPTGAIYSGDYLQGTTIYARSALYVGSAVATDTRFSRTNAGTAGIDSGGDGKWGGLKAGTVALQSLATPGATTVTPTCVTAPCNTTWSYTVEALAGDGTTTIPGAVGTTNVQSANLSATDYNTLTCVAVAGATSYRFRRTVSGGLPATLGVIGTVAACNLVDNGLVGDGSAAPTVNTTGRVTVGVGGLLFTPDATGNIGAIGANRPFNIYASNSVNAGGWLNAGATQGIGFTGRANLQSPADGRITLLNAAATDFSLLQFGGTTAPFPALKRSGTALQARLADDSAYASFHVRSVNLTAQTEGGCVAYTNLAVDGTLNTKVTSASYNFVAADVGGILQITAGTGWTAGDYTVASVADNAATLDRSPAAVSTTNGSFNLNRGRQVMVQGAPGAADTVRTCTKLVDNSYSWVTAIAPSYDQQINAQTDTTYTILATDKTKLVTFSNANPVAVALPQGIGAFAAGYFVDVLNVGAGAVTITPTDCFINGVPSFVLFTGEGVRIVQDGADGWTVDNMIPKAGTGLTRDCTGPACIWDWAAASTDLSDTADIVRGAAALVDPGTPVVVNAAGTVTQSTAVPVWKKYALVAIADGVNGCTNANGCWQVNGVLGADKAAEVVQDVVLFQLPAQGHVSGWRIKTNTACTGTTTAHVGLGTSGNSIFFLDHTYNIKLEVADTNISNGPTNGIGSPTQAATNVVANLQTTEDNIELLAAGCAVDYWVQWAVLP